MIVRQTTKELLAASIMELARTKTVEKITVKEIVQNCGLTSTTFYHYFQDKYQLLAWIYNRKSEALFAEKNVIYTWPQLLRALCAPLLEHPSFFANVLKNTAGNDSFLEKATKYVLTLLNNRIKEDNGGMELPSDIRFYLRFYLRAVSETIAEWFLEGEPIPLDELVSLMDAAMPGPLEAYLRR